MNTKKLYETDSYKKELTTTVTGSRVVKGKNWITLAESIFFPEGGGQYADTGMVNGLALNDGQVMDDEPWYQVDGEFSVGDTVTCELDWQKRYDRMQQHSGEHMLTGVIHNKFNYDNKGFHLSDTDPVTLVFSGMLTKEQIDEMELVANQAIYANMNIVDTYPTDEELAKITYRSKIEIEGQVRLITIKNEEAQLDCCACCAPHVATTGEVGIIKVVSIGKHKGGTQLGILCGRRAFAYMKEQMDLMSSIANSLSTSPDKVASILENQKEEITQLKAQIGALTEQQLLADLDGLCGPNVCIFTEADLSVTTMKNIFNHMTDKFQGYSGIFMGNDDRGYRFSAGSNNQDSRELAKMMRSKLSAKGGGSAQMIQGKIGASREEIEAFFKEL